MLDVAKGAVDVRSASRGQFARKSKRAPDVVPHRTCHGAAVRLDVRETDMQISVSGKNMNTGAAFQTHAEDALNGVVNKYFERAVSGHVTLEKADSGFRVKTRVALSRRIELEATGFAHDAHAALEAAIEHAEKRLRRHKRRLKNHRGTVTQAEADEVLPAPMLVYASAEQLSDEAGDGEADMPAVVAELAYDIEMLTVEQAVMKLELSEAPMLMFRNAAHLGLNVVQSAGSTRAVHAS